MVNIRQEKPADYAAVFHLIKSAFSTMEMSDQSEHFLVNRLRNSDAFIPELSLVAEQNSEIVGHILLTKIQIKNNRKSFDSLALAPVSVLPNFQNQGIGGQLINEAHRVARKMKFSSIILLGHPDYYPRFGYEPCEKFCISIPFDAPAESCMAIELRENSLQEVSGMVVYSKAFFQ